jgi:hypothetical protein
MQVHARRPLPELVVQYVLVFHTRHCAGKRGSFPSAGSTDGVGRSVGRDWIAGSNHSNEAAVSGRVQAVGRTARQAVPARCATCPD